VLHASSFSLSFCLTVLVYQQAGLTAMIRPNAALWTREARVRAVYFHHSMLIPQMGSGFSSVLLVDSYVSRQFPRFPKVDYKLELVFLSIERIDCRG